MIGALGKGAADKAALDFEELRTDIFMSTLVCTFPDLAVPLVDLPPLT
jgi:hypothetical protein